jgi:hypothetical protein
MALHLSLSAPLNYKLGRKILQLLQSSSDKIVRKKNVELISLNSCYNSSFCTLKSIPEKCFINRIERWWVSILCKKSI